MQSVEEIPELGLQHKHSQPPFLEIRWDMLQHNSSIIYLKSVSFTLQVRSNHLSKVPNVHGSLSMYMAQCAKFRPMCTSQLICLAGDFSSTELSLRERLQDMDLVLEEEFLELMVHLFRNLPMGDIWQTDVHPSQSSSGDQEAEILLHLQVTTHSFPEDCSTAAAMARRVKATRPRQDRRIWTSSL